MKQTKIVVIGAGSASFGLANLGAILRMPELAGSELCLVDIKEAGLALVARLAERINKEWGSGFTIRSGTDRTKLLEGADFVILSVAIDREKCWEMDYEIARKHGIMHYAENGGPGGLMHGSRNIALIMPILRDIERLCPDAWVMNFTNPVPRICIAAARFTKLKMVGICHQILFGYLIVANVLARELGIDVPGDVKFRWRDTRNEPFLQLLAEAGEQKLDIVAAGINHFTWMLSIREKHSGRDLYPLFRDAYMSGYGNFEPLTRDMFRLFGTCPVPGDCHMVEYLPYTHNMNRGTWEAYDIQMYPLHTASDERDSMWKDIESMAGWKKPIDHLKSVHTERAEIIIASMMKNAHSYELAVNIPNRGYIGNLPEGAIVEVPADISASSIRGVGVGDLPEPAAELCRRQITIAEMAVRAGVTGDDGLALQALTLDPMIDDPRMARKLLEDYLSAEKEYLPQFFGKAKWL
jgi:alpha-galactosidase